MSRIYTKERLHEFGDRLNTEANLSSGRGRSEKPDSLGKPTDLEVLVNQLPESVRPLVDAVVLRSYARAFWIAAGGSGVPIVELPTRKIDLRMTGRR